MLSRLAPRLLERILSGAAAEPLSASSVALLQHRSLASAAPAQQEASGAGSASQSAEAAGIVIDPSAIARLKQLQANHKGQPVYLRIDVEGGGCSGFQYKFNLSHSIGPDDMVFEKDGGAVVCDSTSLQFLKGAKIEFEDSLMRSAFVVASNPNSESTCGCGSSFVAKM